MTAIQGRTATKELKYLLCDDSGALTIDTTGGDGGATKDNQDTIIANQTNGTQLARAMGSEDPTNPAGTQKQLHVDGNGNLLTIVSNSVNVLPANTLNSGITDAPANSVAVGLKARSNISSAATETFLLSDNQGHLQVDVLNQNQEAQLAAFTNISDTSSVKRLLCDSDGHLQVDIVSGGGGGSSAANTYDTQALTSHTDSSQLVEGAYVDLTNASNVRVEVVFTGTALQRSDAIQDLQFALEYTDDNTATVCYSGASTPSFLFSTLDLNGTDTGFAVANLTEGNNQDSTGGIRGKFCRLVVLNTNASLNNTAYAVSAKFILSGF